MKRSTIIRYRPSALFLAGAALASAVALAPAHAGDPAPYGASSGKQQLDSDRDGKLSRGEAQRDSALWHRFNELDTNRDGVLDAAELAAPDNQAAARGTEVKQ
jgi:hypothetical protein